MVPFDLDIQMYIKPPEVGKTLQSYMENLNKQQFTLTNCTSGKVSDISPTARRRRETPARKAATTTATATATVIKPVLLLLRESRHGKRRN